MLGRDGRHLLHIDRLWTQPLLQRGRPSIDEVPINASWGAEYQELGDRLADDFEAVGNVTGQEDKRPRAALKQLVAAFEEERAVQEIEQLIIAVVDVPGRGGIRRRQDLDQTEGASSRGASRLECHAGGGVPDRLAFIGLQEVGVQRRVVC